MATYTELDQESIKQLLTYYDIGQLREFKPMAGGNANSSIIVNTGEQEYVISVCDEKNRDEITLLTATLDLLNHNGYPTSSLVKTTGSRDFIEYRNKPVYVKKYIDGSVVKNLSPDMVWQIGAALARLHAITAPDFLSKVFAYGIEEFSQLFSKEGEYAGWLENRTTQLKNCCPENLPRGLIHGDLFYDNILFKDDQLCAILDFEEACDYYLIFDIGMCAAGCCTTQSGFSLELTRALLQGYEKQRQLEPIERELLQCHIGYGAIATSFWRYRQFNILLPTPEKKESYLDMKNLADEVMEIPKNTFYQAVFK